MNPDVTPPDPPDYRIKFRGVSNDGAEIRTIDFGFIGGEILPSDSTGKKEKALICE